MQLKANAQPTLPFGTTNINSGQLAEYIIPNGISQISLEVVGGQGGDRESGECVTSGGEGARIRGKYLVSDVDCVNPNTLVLKPGGKLRFVRGISGRFGGGGGGSAVLYLPPSGATWVLLIVAGGGGGAEAYDGLLGGECLGQNGGNAQLSENGGDGGGGHGGNGGSGGGGGQAGGIIPADGGGGGGVYSAGYGGLGNPNGFSGGTAGGNGGVTAGGELSGGFGFGGGGASNIAGGGGGGYSGGGGGSKDGYGGGGGGGSYVVQGTLDVLKDHMAMGIFGGRVGIVTTSGTAKVASIYYVNKAVVGGSNNGSSWANAFRNLQDAIAVASTICNAEIWVAQGTYYVNEGSGLNATDKELSFKMRSGLSIFGGFTGNETSLWERNWFTNRTILSADLSKNDTYPHTDNLFQSFGDNAYHVVTSENTDFTALLDGFVIRGGNAHGSGKNDRGAGIYAKNSSIYLGNNIIEYNHAYQGGGIYFEGGIPNVVSSFIRHNYVVLGAGGVYNNSSSGYFYNNVFMSNEVGTTTQDGGGGGAVLNSVGSDAEFINCSIAGNFANSGGAVYNLGNSHPSFTNVIIWSNKAVTNLRTIESDNTSNSTFRNSLVQYYDLSASNNNLDGSNPANNPKFEFTPDPNDGVIETGNLALQVCSPAINNGADGYSALTEDIAGLPRIKYDFIDIGAYEFQLENTKIWYEDSDQDSYGNAAVILKQCWQPPRYTDKALDCDDTRSDVGPHMLELCDGIDNDCNGKVDDIYTFYHDGDGDNLGNPMVREYRCEDNPSSDEYVRNANDCNDSDPLNQTFRLYVNKNATGLGDGSSWTNAYTSLQDALAHPCKNINEIWVAAGTYYPDEGEHAQPNLRYQSFVMRANVKIYGGFVGNETNLSARNWKLNATILNGDVNNDDSPAGNVFHVIHNEGNNLTNEARLDGFIITNGVARNYDNFGSPGTYLRGGGILNINSYPTIANCIFENNSAEEYGGAIYTGGAGNGIIIENCEFRNNQALKGGGVLNDGNSALIINSLFYKNVASIPLGSLLQANGGALYNGGDATIAIINSTFFGNTAVTNGNDIFSGAEGQRIITNCIFWGNNTPITPAESNVTYSIVQQTSGTYPGTGNLNVNPSFVSSATGDLHLKENSPALNSGNDAANSTTHDLDRNSRIYGTIDRGPYETQPPVACTPISLTSNVLTPLEVSGCGTESIASQTFAYSTSPMSLSTAQYGTIGFQIATGSCALASVSYIDDISEAESATGELVVIRTFTLKDASDNTATATMTITVADNVPPNVITKHVTVHLNLLGNGSLSAAQVDDGSTDNCGISNLSLSKTSFNCTNLGTNTVTLTVTDVNGNSAEGTATITVFDDEQPRVITKDATIFLDGLGMAILNTSQVNFSSFDNCGITSLTLSKTSFDCTNIGDNTVTLTATDASGFSGRSTAKVTVVDNRDPVVHTQPVTIYLDASGVATLTAEQVNSGSTDNCGISSLSLNKTSFNCTNLGTSSVTLTVTDASGNSATGTAAITVVDDIDPVVHTQPVTIYLDATGVATLTAAQVNNGSTDNCGINSLSLSKTSFNCDNVGANTVTLTVTDLSGNSSTGTTTVTVVNNNDPVVHTKSATIYLDANGVATLTAAHVNNGSTGACGINGLSLSKTSFNCSNIGDNTVTLTVTGANGETASGDAVVTVVDNIDPVVHTQPVTIYLNASGLANVSVSQVNNGSTDNCGINRLSLSRTGFGCIHMGANTVTLTVTDASGNSASATAVVTVVDNIDPVVHTQPATIYLDAAGMATLSPAQVDNGSTDNCSIRRLTLSKSSFNCSNIGANSVTLTAEDNGGNGASGTATVTVVDELDPVVKTQPATIYLDANGLATLTVAQVNNGSSDNCGIGEYLLSKSSFTCSDLGANTITLTAKDASGNSGSATATVTVVDNVVPVANCKTATVYLGTNGQATITAAAINNNSSDNCTSVANLDLSISRNTFTSTDLAGACQKAFDVILTVRDQSGNVSKCTTQVTAKRRITQLVYNGATEGQFSDPANLSATLYDITDGVPGVVVGSKTVNFTLGTQSVSDTYGGAGGGTDVNGVASGTIVLNQNPAGTFTVTSTFPGDAVYCTSTTSTAFDIKPEDICAEYNGQLSVAATVLSKTSNSAQVIMSVGLADATDGSAGDVTKAIVEFNYNGTWIAAPVQALNTGKTTGNASLTATITFVGDATNLSFAYRISGYYQINPECSDDGQSVINVYKPQGEFITGGGYIVPTNKSVGIMPADSARKANFGFNVKYNQKNTNLMGSINYIFRRKENGVVRLYQVKGNSMTSLTVNMSDATEGAARTAVFIGKCNISDVTNPSLPVPVPNTGNSIMQVIITDAGIPGTNDKYGITVWNSGNQLLHSSNWESTKTTKLALRGGNIVISGATSSTASRSGDAAVTTTESSTTANSKPVVMDEAGDRLYIMAMPNPSSTNFKIVIEANNLKTPVQVIVTDIMGRRVETLTTNAGQTLNIGSSYKNGAYIVRVYQGSQVRTLKLVKL